VQSLDTSLSCTCLNLSENPASHPRHRHFPHLFLSLAFPFVSLPFPIFFSRHHVVYLLLIEDQQQYLVLHGNFSTTQFNQHPVNRVLWQELAEQQGYRRKRVLAVSTRGKRWRQHAQSHEGGKKRVEQELVVAWGRVCGVKNKLPFLFLINRLGNPKSYQGSKFNGSSQIHLTSKLNMLLVKRIYFYEIYATTVSDRPCDLQCKKSKKFSSFRSARSTH